MAATLLELTSQGDVGTMTDESKLGQITLQTPQQLYELWERQHWQAHAIDFSQDIRDWAALEERERSKLLWNLSSFFVGEERVAREFSGLVLAAADQSEEAFLCTQQVDEARHAQHFSRFYEQVLSLDGTIEDRLGRARENITPSFVEMFDQVLVDYNQRLIAEPTDTAAKVDFVVLYHMVIEGCLALTGQYFITEYMEKRGILPGFVEGFRLISRDEHRHVAYGTWYLQQAAFDPELRRRIGRKLVELIPLANGVLVPPGADPNNYEILGYTMEETNTFAFNALNRRLKVIGVDLVAAAQEAPAAA